MNWKNEAMDELREYEAKRQAAHSIPQELQQLRSQMVRTGGSNDFTPVKGGTSQWEDRQIHLILRIDKLEASLRCARDWVERVEQGLAVLTPEERLILERFYISPAKGNVDRLCEELLLEKTAVYSRKDGALRKYTLARYGCLEI